ncbi:MAG: LCP family protein [Oscillospiraceae bacterium]|nr:LCP family protein [Oscillospiraceae bacterium]
MKKTGKRIKKMLTALFFTALAASAAASLRGALPNAGAEAASETGRIATQQEPLAAASSANKSPERRKTVYTLLLAGVDEVSGNTDTILLGRLDAEARRMDFVSIPRDTYVNLPWSVRKINCVYAGTKASGQNGLEGLRSAVRSLTGFDTDCCAVVDLSTVKTAIEMMGGVYFDVPFDMDYEDSAQDLHIHIPAGYQRLDGEQCIQLCRYRKDYVNGDIDRIALQHDFLRAAAKQFISLGSIPNLSRVIQLISSSVDSDLTPANVAYFLRCALQCRAEDISFYTMPNVPADAGGLSYTFVDLAPWLTLLNDALNPFDAAIEPENLDVVYLENGAFRSTSGFIRDERYLYR